MSQKEYKISTNGKLDVFKADAYFERKYQEFSRSFSTIKSNDIEKQINKFYEHSDQWTKTLLTMNPAYKSADKTLEEMEVEGVDPALKDIFSFGEKDNRTPMRLYTHQQCALELGIKGENFIVTTGTGSGKSLCFFLPIINKILAARRAGDTERRIRAVIIYPMNALANSQLKELEKYISNHNLTIDASLRPTFGRYTGQDSQEKRLEVAQEKPDILLTNYMMFERLMMSQKEDTDKEVRNAMKGLEFLVLDELHSYRGRQGADVAMLVRRIRAHMNKNLTCIGTSATMVSQEVGEKDDPNESAKIIAEVGTKFFGNDRKLKSENIIEETLTYLTQKYEGSEEEFKAELRQHIIEETAPPTEYNNFRVDPIAHWIDVNLNFDPDSKKRRPPRTMKEAAELLFNFIGEKNNEELMVKCGDILKSYLRQMSITTEDDSSDRVFMGFKIHHFLSRPSGIGLTLEGEGKRTINMNGERIIKSENGEGERHLLPIYFCYGCGQEVYPVIKGQEGGKDVFIGRALGYSDKDEDGENNIEEGVFIPVVNDDFSFTGDLEDYPAEYLDGKGNIKRDKKKNIGRRYYVTPDREIKELSKKDFDAFDYDKTGGVKGWFFGGKFHFCPTCQEYDSHTQERNRLAGVSGEGRSSAITEITSSLLEAMNYDQVPENRYARKILTFSDSRQDVSLQAGHFNDFIFITLMRAALLNIVEKNKVVVPDLSIGRLLRQALGFDKNHTRRLKEWRLAQTGTAYDIENDEIILNDVLTLRAWADLGKRLRNNPNLIDLGMVEEIYPSLDEFIKRDDIFDVPQDESGGRKLEFHPLSKKYFSQISSDKRKEAFLRLFKEMRERMALNIPEAFNKGRIKGISEKSRSKLKSPWSISEKEQENILVQKIIYIKSNSKNNKKSKSKNAEFISGASKVAKEIEKILTGKLEMKKDEREIFLNDMLKLAKNYLFVKETSEGGWQLDLSKIKFVLKEQSKHKGNQFFKTLYQDISDQLESKEDLPIGFEGREHSGQVEMRLRQLREARFRYGKKDEENIEKEYQDVLEKNHERSDFLPLLFCSPTMELGVDISQMNIVCMRNAPPTPANYAQRAGRGGRSGQAALIITYCSAQSPHDQHYFSNPQALVNGSVSPPAIDLSNKDLLVTHIQAEWLIAAELDLKRSIFDNLTINNNKDPSQMVLKADLVNKMRNVIDDQAAKDRAINIVLSTGYDAQKAEKFVDKIWSKAPDNFQKAFDRWCNLYSMAHKNIEQGRHTQDEADRLSGKQREDTKRQGWNIEKEGKRIKNLLERGRA